MRISLHFLFIIMLLGSGCRTARTSSSPTAAAQSAPAKSATVEPGKPGIVFISGRLMAFTGKMPKAELISIQKATGRLKMLPSKTPQGPPPFFGFTTTGTTTPIQGYLPHPLYPRLEVQHEQGDLETTIGKLTEAEFVLRLPVLAGMDSIRFFEVDSTNKTTFLATFPL